MARFYPPGGGGSGTGGSSIDFDQITAPRRLIATGYKTLTSDSIGEIVEGTLPKLSGGAFYDGDVSSPDAFNISKITTATHNQYVGGFDFVLDGYFDNTADKVNTKVHIPNCIPANIKAGVKVGGTNGFLTGTFTADATGIASDIKSGKTAYVNGTLVTGSMPVNNALNSSIDAGGSIEIPEGYYPAGKITANSLSSQTVGTAVASDIKNNKTAWVNGVLVTGTIAIREALNSTMNADDIINVPEGYYPAGKITANSLSSQTSGTGIASDIKKGKTVWVNGVLITGTMTVNTKIDTTLNAGQSINIPDGYHPVGTVKAKSLADQTPATAGILDIRKGMTAWVDGILLTGTMPNNAAINTTLDAGESFTVPAGYTVGGKVSAKSLADQTAGTAIASDIKTTKTAWVDGVLVTGTMPVNTAVSSTLNAGQSVTIKEGYHPAGSVKAASLDSQTAGTAIASDIKSTKTAWVDGVLVTGSMVINAAINKTLETSESIEIKEGYYLASKITAKSLALQTVGTAVAGDIKKDKTGWVNGVLITGNMPVNTKIDTTLNAGGSINIPAGYHPAGVVRAKSLEDQTVGTAVASDIKNSKTAWVNGLLVTGTIPVRAAINSTINAGGSVEIPEGYYPASKVTAKSLADQTAGTAVDANILNGKTAWVDGVLVTGTMANIAAVDPAKSLTFPTTPVNNTYFYARMSSGAHVTNASSGYPEVQIPQSMVVSAGKITADKIAAKKTILGVNGTFSSDATAAADHIAEGQTAYVNGEKITGTAILADMILNQPLYKVFENMQREMSLNVGPRSRHAYDATKFVVSKNPPSANITSANNGLTDMTLFNSGSILSWYEISESEGGGDYECVQYIWSKYGKVILLTARELFADYIYCKSIDLSLFDTRYCTNFSGMFVYCGELTSLDLSNIVTPSGTYNGTSFDVGFMSMFDCCTKLTNINYGSNFNLIDNFNKLIVVDTINISSCMFFECPANKPTGGNWDIGMWDNIGTYHIPVYLATGTVVNNALTKDASNIVIYNPFPNPVSLDTNTLGFIRDDVNIPASTVDISRDGDGSIVTWYESTDSTQYIYYESDMVVMHPNSSRMFENCTAIQSIDISTFNSSNVTSMAWMFANCTALKNIHENFDTSNVTSISNMFDGCASLTNLYFNWNTPKLVIMTTTFRNCSSLKSLHIDSFNTSNVTDMGWLFQGCSALSTLDISSFNTSKVTNMANMFYGCESLTSLDISHFNTSNVTSISNMFYNCSSLTSLDLSNFNTSKVTNMGSIFANSGFVSLNVSKFDTSKVTNMGSMFYGCPALTSIIGLENFDTSNITNMRSMFNKCTSLKTIDLSSFNTANTTSFLYMFYGTNANIVYGPSFAMNDTVFDSTTVTTEENLTCGMYYGSGSNKPEDGKWAQGTWNTSGTFLKASVLASGTNVNKAINKAATSFVRSTTAPAASVTTTDISRYTDNSIVTWYDATTTTQYYYASLPTIMTSNSRTMFKGCNKMTSIDLSTFNTSADVWMDDMFYGCSALTTLDLSHFDTSKVFNMGSMFNGCESLTSLNVSNFDTSNVVSMNLVFNGCASLTSLDLSSWNTEKVMSMFNLFSGCRSLKSLNLAKFDTSNATSMYMMFYNCRLLSALDLAKFNTSKVTDMSYMFDGCSGLALLNIDGWDVSNVTKMDYMFNGCGQIASLKVSTWNTSKVTTMKSMFSGCYSLTSLDVSKWNTTNVTDMENMFSNCSAITSLNLSGWNTSKVTTMKYMFIQCYDLASLNVAGWDVSKVTTMHKMFMNDRSLATLDLSGWNTVNVSDMNGMFWGCSLLNTLKMSDFNTTHASDMSEMFYACGGKASSTMSITYGANFVLPEKILNTCIIDNATNKTFKMFTGCAANKPTGGNWYSGVWVDGTFLSETTFATGELVNKAINKSCKYFERAYELPASGTTTDISANNDKSILTWYDETAKTQYWYAGYAATAYLNPNCYKMFNMCTELIEISFADWNMSKVTNMAWMYANCTKLSIADDIYGVDTSKVTDMSCLFYYCQALTSLDLSTWDTSNVESLDSTFHNCTNLRDLKISTWDTSNVTDMWQLFAGCISLDALDLSSWNTAKVTNMGYTFSSCNLLTSLDIVGWDTSKVTNMQYMFSDLGLISDINYGANFVLPQAILETCIIDDELTNMTYGMFYNTNVSTPTGGNWDNGTWIYGGTYLYITYLTTGNKINEAINKSATSFMKANAAPASSITVTDISRDNDGSVVTWYDSTSKSQYYYSTAGILMNEDASYTFNGCANMTTIDILSWHANNVTDVHHMFSGCSSLSTLDLSNFTTASLLSVDYMFNECSSLISLDISGLNTESLLPSVGYSMMFYNAAKLTSITYGGRFRLAYYIYNQCQVDNDGNLARSMFYNCPANKPTGGNWDKGDWQSGTFISEYVTQQGNSTGMLVLPPIFMIQYMDTLQRTYDANAVPSDAVDISYNSKEYIRVWESEGNGYIYAGNARISLNTVASNLLPSGLTSFSFSDIEMVTERVTDMSYMFHNRKDLTNIDFTGVDTSNVTTMQYMFAGTSALKTVTYGTFKLPGSMLASCTKADTTNPTYQMFYNSTAPKPTSGNWAKGTWNSDGTFIKS